MFINEKYEDFIMQLDNNQIIFDLTKLPVAEGLSLYSIGFIEDILNPLDYFYLDLTKNQFFELNEYLLEYRKSKVITVKDFHEDSISLLSIEVTNFRNKDVIGDNFSLKIIKVSYKNSPTDDPIEFFIANNLSVNLKYNQLTIS